MRVEPCKSKERGKVSRRGELSIEWYKDDKPQYYCYGYIDKMTDDFLPECKECRSHVSKAQDDLDKFYGRTGNIASFHPRGCVEATYYIKEET